MTCLVIAVVAEVVEVVGWAMATSSAAVGLAVVAADGSFGRSACSRDIDFDRSKTKSRTPARDRSLQE